MRWWCREPASHPHAPLYAGVVGWVWALAVLVSPYGAPVRELLGRVAGLLWGAVV